MLFSQVQSHPVFRLEASNSSNESGIYLKIHLLSRSLFLISFILNLLFLLSWRTIFSTRLWDLYCRYRWRLPWPAWHFVPLSQRFCILYLWNCSPSSGKYKSDRWRKSVQFSGRRKMSILKKTSTWVTRMDESKKNCLVDTDPMTVKSKANVLILWKDFSIQGKKRLIKTKMKRMRQRTEIDHQRTPQQSKKEKGKARKEQRLNHQIQHKALKIFRGLDYSL